jgi:ABC-2 type transport system permease protein
MTDALDRFTSAWAVALRVSAANLRARMGYRSDFVMALVIGVAWQAAVLVFIGVLLSRFQSIAGWDQDSVLLIAAMRMLSHGLYLVFFGNVNSMVLIVQEGRIDGFLLRPLPVYRQVLLYAFPINAIGELAVGASLLAVAVGRLPVSWDPARCALLAAGPVGGMLVEAAVQTVISAGALRFPGAQTWTIWVDELFSSFGNYPSRVLGPLPRAVLTYLLPISFVAYLPAAAVLGLGRGSGVPSWLATASPLVGLLAYVAARCLWRWSLRFYQGVGG